ncbi:hypothetical protein BKA67DRAFT_542339 [Truncatella angustata]|uniref:Uncharacterized protein n=1 Tax=Truncatella angustata TaxID=152316 RepID=A0A9P8UAZ7_9PEZI|nr:uncharacterized protein BKA67DRAFT_542339 [Truncatella angustata]KAH6643380.1 hypothetical protein BKA67DRAFT_542339 [Truncatella angustata]
MLTVSGLWAPIGLTILSASVASGSALHHAQDYNVSKISHATIAPSAAPVVFHSTSSCSNSTSSVPSTVISYTTSTAHCSIIPGTTVTVISDKSYTTTLVSTVTEKETVVQIVTYKETEADTSITTTTVPTTTTTTAPTTTTTTTPTTVTSITSFTSYSTITTTTTRNSCDATCSVYAGTVELFFWPTNNDYSYPATYVDTRLDYTFVSPSVYYMINTIHGVNISNGAVVGPYATSTIFGFDLGEVSTIVGGTITQQLTLNDLGTDCPRTVDASAIATLVDSRCDPILAAPSKIREWAQPCAACQRLGLFDPPYAIPTLTGGLVETTTVAETTITPVTTATTKATATAVPITITPTTVATVPTSTAAETSVVETTATAAPTTTANSATITEILSIGPSGVVIVKVFSGTSVTLTIPAATGASTVVIGDQTYTLPGSQSSTASAVITVPSAVTSETSPTSILESSSLGVSGSPTAGASGSSSLPSATTTSPSSTTSSTDPVATAAASKVMGGFTYLLSSILVAILAI